MKEIRLIIVFICCALVLFGQGEDPAIKRLKKSLEGLGENKTRVDTLNELAFLFIYSNLDTAQQYASQADAIARKIKYIRGQGSSQVRLGQIKMYQSKFDESKEHFKEGLKLRKQIGHQSDIVSIYLNLGVMYTKAGNPVGAIDNYDLGLELLNELNRKSKADSLQKAKMYNNLGSAYKEVGKYKKAEYHFEKSIELWKRLPNKVKLANTYMNLGSLYYQEEFTDTLKSQDYLHRSLDIFIEHERERGQALCFINLGNLFFHENRHEEALKYFAKAKEKKGALYPSEMIKIARNEGSVFYKRERYEDALTIFEDCLREYEDASNKTEMAYLYRDIGNVHFTQSNFKKADYYLNKSLTLADDLKLFGLKTASLSSIVNVQERELFKEQLHKKTILLIGLLALAMVLTVAGFLIHLNRKKRQIAEKNALLSKQKIDVLVGHQVLKTTSARLEGIEQERKRIASELHDEVGVMLSTAKLYFAPMDEQLKNLEERDKDKYKRATQILDETYDAVRRISHDMASPSLSNLGLVKELQLLVEKIKEVQHLNINLNVHDMHERLDNNIEIRLYRIIQELLTNALKHAHATEINIELNHFKEFINVIIEDNGVGFDQRAILNNPKTGLGINNIKIGLAELQGTFSIDSKKGRGTSISLDIPLKN